MFGITDPGIYWAYLLIFLCLAFSIIYGIINWNKGGESDEEEIMTDIQWEKKENELNDQEA